MKLRHAILAFTAATTLALVAKEEVLTESAHGTWEIVRNVRNDVPESIRFPGSSSAPVPLENFPWRGVYSISPDDRWILRTQKTSSGESVAILYRMENNRRISQVIGFDDSLWAASDSVSRLKKADLYHTAVKEVSWSKDSRTLQIVLQGSNVSQNGDGIETRLSYNLIDHSLSAKPHR